MCKIKSETSLTGNVSNVNSLSHVNSISMLVHKTVGPLQTKVLEYKTKSLLQADILKCFIPINLQGASC